ncbi:MAG: YdcF family protein [Vicinamibacterales bacterium]
MSARADVRRRWRRCGGVFLLLAVASIWPLRQAGTALVVVREIDQPDAIVSLASHEWERLPDAAALARRAPKATVVLSQPIAVNAFNCHDCGHRLDRLVAAGVEPTRIALMERKVFRTLDEAQAFKEWAAGRQVRSVMVVTSPYHTARALASFRHVLSGTGIAVGVHPAAGSPAEPRAWWRHKYDRWYVSYEWRARLFYLVRFGIR